MAFKIRCGAHLAFAAAAAALAIALAAPALAATTTTTMQVTATVSSTCTVSTTNLAFGAYIGVQLDGTATIAVTCNDTAPYTVGLSAGIFSGAGVTTRRMSGPGSAGLAFSLSRNAARTLNWGDTPGTDTVAGTGNGAAQSLTVYGRVAAGQAVAPGGYADTITITVDY